MAGIDIALARIGALHSTIERLTSLGGPPAASFATVLRQTEAGTPLRPPVSGRISSTFGARHDPLRPGRTDDHTGVDLAAPAGSPVVAARAGVVSFAGERGGYGRLVIIDHPDGMQTFYAHQQELLTQAGRFVQAGEPIGLVGSTGRSTGPHLHFEVRIDGEPVDPLPLLEKGP